jgi:Dynamin family
MTDLEQAQRTAARVADLLDRAADLLGLLALAGPAANLQARAGALRADCFNVLVLGEFSRGKSTLLNAMLGCNLLPQKMTPSTALVTVIRYGELPTAVVYYHNDDPAHQGLPLEEFRRTAAR